MAPGTSQIEQYNTKEIQQKDKDHFVHPWQIFDLFREHDALPVARGEGCHTARKYSGDDGRVIS